MMEKVSRFAPDEVAATPGGNAAGGQRLFCDVMLGKLARELRLLGMDVEYSRTAAGIRAYREARAQARTFLTRSKKLAKLPGTIYLASPDPSEQVAELKQKLAGVTVGSLRKEDAGQSPFSRCSCCNESLTKISREEARPFVPFFIYQIHHDFNLCPKCRRVYWPGSHSQHLRRKEQPSTSAASRQQQQQVPQVQAEQQRIGRQTRYKHQRPQRGRTNSQSTAES